jgi:chitodextrinase
MIATFKSAGPSDITNPTDPTNLTCSGPTSSAAAAAWTASTDNVGVDHYNVRMSTGAGTTPTTIVAQPTTTSVAIAGLTASTLYRFTVQAADASGNLSNQTSICQATTLPPLTGQFTWNDNATDETSQSLYRCTPVYPATTCDPTTGSIVSTPAANVTSLTLAGQPNPAACYAMVANKTGAADSTFSNTSCDNTSGPTPPAAPSGFRFGN